MHQGDSYVEQVKMKAVYNYEKCNTAVLIKIKEDCLLQIYYFEEMDYYKVTLFIRVQYF